jgi:hypothetical protein
VPAGEAKQPVALYKQVGCHMDDRWVGLNGFEKNTQFGILWHVS